MGLEWALVFEVVLAGEGRLLLLRGVILMGVIELLEEIGEVGDRCVLVRVLPLGVGS